VIFFFRKVAESSGILIARLIHGDEAIYEKSKEISPKERSELASDHPNQTSGIIEGWQDEQE